MTYHYIKIILAFISSVTWPIVVILIISYFKKPISQFLRKVRKVSYGEASVERSAKKQKEEKLTIDILTKGKDFNYIDDTLNKFSEFGKELAFDIINNETKILEVDDVQQKFDRILKYSQLLIIVKNSERIYRSIYGSQIRLLQKLNYSSENIDNIKYFYDNAVKHYPDNFVNYDYISYLSFLENNGLIIFDRDSSILSISEVGKDFLRYLIESNLNFDKLF